MSQDFTRFFQPGVPADIAMPTGSLVDLYERAVAEAGPFIATDFFGHTKTYEQLGDEISRAAEGLRQLGVRAGDRVALILPNCPQHVIAFYAVLRLGAIVVEHNPLYTSRELRHMFEDHAARVAICWDMAVKNLLNQPDDIALSTIIAVNLLDEFPASLRFALSLPLPSLRQKRAALTAKTHGAISWKRLLSNDGLDPATPRPELADVAAIQYTSGTTGQPKGAMLTHSNLYCNALQGEAWMHGAEYHKEIFYAVLPLFHAFGMTLFLTYGILKQAHIVLFPSFDPAMVVAKAKKLPPTVFCAVPPIFERTAELAKKKKVSLQSAKYCISGAMTLPESTVALWESQSGGLLVEGYGMTEASPIITGNPFFETRRTGTIGLPFPSTQVKVTEPNNPDRTVPAGERGELLVHGPQVFKGYWNNPVETEITLLPGGWLRTGDLVTQDEDGFITIVDRLKELVIVGGFNVSPSEVESVLRSHPSIADAAVVGLPAPSGGERLVAAVVPHDGATVDAEAVKAFCRERLTHYKVPREINIVDALPKSMLGKVLRGDVRTMIEQLNQACTE
ncbi:MAG: long-chain-fatty-acid--CoA ligase [Micrococcales bacterium]|nr:long-chain-fatty-acid--CoA ligase [Micrococcales bacterium]